MGKSRYEKGKEKLMEFTNISGEGSNHLQIEESLKDIAPDISRFMIEFTYGDIYTRKTLDNKQRALITIAALVSQASMPQLELHINAGLTAGLSPEEIIESFIQLLSYVGFPKVLNAVELAKKVFRERELEVNINI